MRFTLEITCAGAAFGDSDDDRARELARILRHAAERIEANGYGAGVTRGLTDLNGNARGSFTFEERDE